MMVHIMLQCLEPKQGLPGQADAVRQAAAAAAQPGFDVDAELDRLGMEEKSLRESARRKVGRPTLQCWDNCECSPGYQHMIEVSNEQQGLV